MLKYIFIALTFFAALAVEAQAVTIDWSPVGNAGNSNDTADGDIKTAGIQHFGGVAYNYRIGTYDVTTSQYAEFLNAKDPTGANSIGLFNNDMGNGVGGISFNNGALPGTKYSANADRANGPVIFVTWYSAIRFSNWMNNGQGNGDTETGAYTLLHDGSASPTPIPSNANLISRQPGATIFLPSENEWYKAAYYNPSTHSYFQYPTSTDTTPTPSPPTSIPNHANFFSPNPEDPPLFATDVGAYTGTTSPYGAFDMGGNVFQFNEALIGSFRGIRGGSWGSPDSNLLSSFRDSFNPSFTSGIGVGFRLAMIPEPSSLVLAALGLIGFAAWGWRRRKG
jgi:formylglycine-generating enzyme